MKPFSIFFSLLCMMTFQSYNAMQHTKTTTLKQMLAAKYKKEQEKVELWRKGYINHMTQVPKSNPVSIVSPQLLIISRDEISILLMSN